MAHQLDLIPEGKAERVLLQVMGYQNPNNAEGIGDTLNKIERYFNGRFALGIVDDDKRKPALFDRYQLVMRQQHSLTLLQKRQSLHFLIVIHPALEAWLLECANRCGLQPIGFSGIAHLKEVTKDLRVANNLPFRNFLHTLYANETSGLRTLKDWIEDLRSQYAW